MIRKELLLQIKADNKQANAALDQTQTKVQNLGKTGKSSTDNISSGFGNITTKAVAVAAAIVLIAGKLREASKEAIEAQLVFTRMAMSMDSMADATKINDWADAMQATTIHTAQAALATANMIKIYNKDLSADKVQALAQATLAMSDAYGKQSQKMAKAVARAIKDDDVGMLKTLGVTLSDVSSKQAIYNSILEEGNEDFKTSIALGESAAGTMIRNAHAWGNFSEQVGNVANTTVIALNDIAASAIGSGKDATDALGKVLNAVIGGIMLGITTVGSVMGAVVVTYINMIQFLAKSIISFFKMIGLNIYRQFKQIVDNAIAAAKAVKAAFTLNFAQASQQISKIRLVPDFSAISEGFTEIRGHISRFGSDISTTINTIGQTLVNVGDRFFDQSDNVDLSNKSKATGDEDPGTGDKDPEGRTNRQTRAVQKQIKAIDRLVVTLSSVGDGYRRNARIMQLINSIDFTDDYLVQMQLAINVLKRDQDQLTMAMVRTDQQLLRQQQIYNNQIQAIDLIKQSIVEEASARYANLTAAEKENTTLEQYINNAISVNETYRQQAQQIEITTRSIDSLNANVTANTAVYEDNAAAIQDVENMVSDQITRYGQLIPILQKVNKLMLNQRFGFQTDNVEIATQKIRMYQADIIRLTEQMNALSSSVQFSNIGIGALPPEASDQLVNFIEQIQRLKSQINSLKQQFNIFSTSQIIKNMFKNFVSQIKEVTINIIPGIANVFGTAVDSMITKGQSFAAATSDL